MADDVTFQSTTPATPPAGTVVSADEETGTLAKLQRVKLAHSADGSAAHVQADADGVLVNLGTNNDVGVSSSALPTGAATAAKQDTLIGHVDGIETALAAPLPLPTGAATSAKQDTLAALVDGIEGLLGTIDADTGALAGQVGAGGLKVDLGADNDVTVTGTVTVQDGGGSITVDGTVAATVVALPLPSGAATSALQGGGLPAALGAGGGVKVDGSGTALPVSGTVTANAGTNLNTSALATEAGGNLAAAATSLAILDDWDETDRAKVNPIAGQAGVQGGSGAVTALTQRAVLATDVALPAGTNEIGKLAAGTARIGAVTSGLRQARISQAPTISAAAIYASGDAVGGLLTFANAAAVSGSSITITAVVILDNDQELAPLELVLFDRTFSATADNAPFDATDAEMLTCVGVIKVSDYASFVDNAVATRQCSLTATLNGTSLFGQLVVRSTPTYTATTDITVVVQVVQD